MGMHLPQHGGEGTGKYKRAGNSKFRQLGGEGTEKVKVSGQRTNLHRPNAGPGRNLSTEPTGGMSKSKMSY